MEDSLKTGGSKAGSDVGSKSDDYSVGYYKSISADADFYTNNNTIPTPKNNINPTEEELVAVATFSPGCHIT
eukprot:3752145-Ditylum_brightwellii.AAC.1